MLQLTLQSRKVILTEDEKNYFAKATNEDLCKFTKNANRSRESTKTMAINGFKCGVDYYKDMRGKQHTYDVSWKQTSVGSGGFLRFRPRVMVQDHMVVDH